MLIPSAVKAKAIKLLENEMTTPCTIYRAGTAVSDGMGGYTDGSDVKVEDTTCFIGALGSSSQEREIAAQNQESVLHTVRFPHDCAITKNHWMVANSYTYHVLGCLKSDGSADVYKRVVMRLDR